MWKTRRSNQFIGSLKHTRWNIKKTVLGFAVDMVDQVITLSMIILEKFYILLAFIPSKVAQVSKNRCYCLLRINRIIVPTVAGAEGIFIRLKISLWDFRRQHVLLAMTVHKKLKLWWYLITPLTYKTTHLQKNSPHPLTLTGANGASLKRIGIFFWYHRGDSMCGYYLWGRPTNRYFCQRITYTGAWQ